MALKPDRHINPYGTEITYVLNTTADAGLFMVYGTAGSGSAVSDATRGTVSVGPSNPSGQKVAGLLMHPFVAFDDKKHRNWYQVTQYPGEPAPLLRDGWVTTNSIVTGVTPDAGKVAYLGADGKVTDAGPGPKVGEFMSAKDEAGYCRLKVELPA